MSIGGAAAGLNLGVMEITDSTSTEAAEEVLLASGSGPIAQDPLQVVVDVPVVVPDSVVATTLAEAAPAKTSLSAPAPAQTRVEGAATTTTSNTPPATKASAIPTNTAAAAAAKAPVTTTAVAATEYKYYDFPGVASQIIVARHGDGSLEFWSVTTESGWSYQVEEDSSRLVEVEFSQEPNGEGEAKWILQYTDGDLEVKKEISFEDEDEEEDDD